MEGAGIARDEPRQSENDVEPKKKARQRKKLIISKIRTQMEFYFSPANLSKDKFMDQLLRSSPYIDLEIFFKFNRIRALTDDMNLLRKAIEKSKILELSGDELSVKRSQKVKMKNNELQCTIYVECIPSHVDHEWVHEMFAQYGTIDYLSFPHFKSTGRPKGFAFVEYQTPEMAITALEAFGAIGCKIPVNTEPSTLQSILSHEGTDVFNENQSKSGEYNENRTQVCEVPGDDRECRDQLVAKETLEGEISDKEVDQEKRKIEDEVVEKSKKVKAAADEECDGANTDGDNAKTTKKKRKLEDSKEGEMPKTGDSTVEDDEEESDKQEVLQEAKGDAVAKKRKIKSTSEVENVIKKVRNEIEEAKKLGTTSEEDKSSQSSKKRPLDDSEDVQVQQSKKKNVMVDTTNTSLATGIDKEQSVAMEGTPSLIVKKKKKKRKRTRKEKEVLEGMSLKVMAKQEWCRLRNQYLNMQKRNMESLKWDLKKMRYVPTVDYEEYSGQVSSKGKPTDEYVEYSRQVSSKAKPPEFLPNVIIKISFEEPPQDPKKLQEAIKEGSGGGIAYVEVSPVEKDVYVRFISAGAASGYLKAGLWSRMILLSGEEEKEYWEHFHSSWHSRRNKKNKMMKETSVEYPSKIRGRDKLMQKALKEARNKPNSHVVFDG